MEETPADHIYIRTENGLEFLNLHQKIAKTIKRSSVEVRSYVSDLGMKKPFYAC